MKILHKLNQSFFSRLVALGLGTIIISFQLFGKNEDFTWDFWHHPIFSLKIFHDKPFTVYGRFTEDQRHAAEWLNHHAEKSQAIIGDGYSHESLDFYLKDRSRTPIFHPLKPFSKVLEEMASGKELGKPLFIITYKQFRSSQAIFRDQLYIVFEAHIVEEIKDAADGYFVMSGAGGWIRHYLDRVAWASRTFRERFTQIYRISTKHPDFGISNYKLPADTFPYVSANLDGDLKWLKKSYPAEYQKVESALNQFNIDRAILSEKKHTLHPTRTP